MKRVLLGANSGLTPAYASGWYYFTSSTQSSQALSNLGVGTLRMVPWVVTRTITLSRIGAEITVVGDAGSKLRLVIYTDNGSGFPSSLVVDAGQVAGDSVGRPELTISQVLTPGVYWVGGVVQAVTTTQPTVLCVNGWAPPIQIAADTAVPGAGAAEIGMQMSGVTAAAPATTSSVTSSNRAARVFVKIA